MAKRSPVLLIVMDGFGIAPSSPGNAIVLAKKPVLDGLVQQYPASVVQAAGEGVGLPWQEMGNSEVGHLNIGAGRIIYQELPKINKTITDGTFFKNPSFLKAIEHAKNNNSTLHLVGLTSPGGVHSHIEHLFALMELAHLQRVKHLAIHVITDGRDTSPKMALDSIAQIEKHIKEMKVGAIATVGGRYFGMDRDERWDREQKAYDVMVHGKGPTAASAAEAVQASYEKDIADEYIEPVVIVRDGKPVAQISSHDSVIFYNFRSDRAKQITKAITLPGFDKFDRGEFLKDVLFVTMTEYDTNLPVEIAFPKEEIKNSLAEVISKHGLLQFHIAETEKFAHVTVFLNCGKITAFPGEDRLLISSPKVATYDQQPEMSAPAITENLIKVINQEKYDFLVVNFANADMVGHSGVVPATIRAVEILDACIGKVLDALFVVGGKAVIVADHGNAEVKVNLQTGDISKEHTANPVPFILADPARRHVADPNANIANLSLLAPIGVLSDVAPTLLAMMHVNKPSEMSGISLYDMM